MKTNIIGMIIIIGTLFLSCAEKQPGKPIIGISKIAQHEALDAIEQGIIDRLAEQKIDVTFDLQNANGNVNTAAQIANKFKSEKVAVAVGIATPVAIALANTITDTPVIFSCITDPIAAGLVSGFDKGERNVTGVSDVIPTKDHIKLFQEIAGIKTLGYIYTASEANSLSSLELVKDACNAFGIELVTQAIATSAELKQASEAIVNRVDGIYLTTDNTVFSALPALIQVFGDAKKPIFSGDVTAAMNGGCMIASGFNYYKAGLATGDMIIDVLNGKNPEDIPVMVPSDPADLDMLFDLDAAANCGISIPENYVSMASKIFVNGNLTEK
jgi:putative ABC transport system substrate-binding protein